MNQRKTTVDNRTSEAGGVIGKTLFFGLAALIVVGIASSATNAGKPPAQRPGIASVYAEIAAETSCATLQKRFDHAAETNKRSGYVPNGPAFEGARGARWSEVGLGYMEAADYRMKQIGCYR